MNLQSYTVLGYSSQPPRLAGWQVRADSPAAAFAAARQAAGTPSWRGVAALPGVRPPGAALVWPGAAPVTVDAILAQPERFGAPLYAVLQRERQALVITAAGPGPERYVAGRWPLAAAAFLEGVLDDAPDMATLGRRLTAWPAWAARAAGAAP